MKNGKEEKEEEEKEESQAILSSWGPIIYFSF